jgi:phenylacetate-CoA ligase
MALSKGGESVHGESREARERQLNQSLRKIVRHAYKNAPAIKEKFDIAGVPPSAIRTIKDLEKIPVTTKDELLNLQRANPPFGGFLAVPITSLSRIYVSPGPIYDPWDRKHVKSPVKMYEDVFSTKPGDIVMVSSMFHMVPLGLAATDALTSIGCVVIPAGVGQTELQVQIMRELKVIGYCGFPSFLMSMLKKAEEMGYDFRRDFNLKWVLATGERHIQELRREFEEDYGLQVIQVYGTADLGAVAYECNEKNGMHYADDMIVEIVDPDTGKQLGPHQEGEVVVTMLNKGYPLIRFGTGDLSFYTDEPCPCGRASPRLTHISGMIGDHIRAKGMFIHHRELDEAMSKFTEVSKYQLVISLHGHKDWIGLNVETKANINQETLSIAIQERCKEVFKLKVDEISFLPKGQLAEGYKIFVDNRWKEKSTG